MDMWIVVNVVAYNRHLERMDWLSVFVVIDIVDAWHSDVMELHDDFVVAVVVVVVAYAGVHSSPVWLVDAADVVVVDFVNCDSDPSVEGEKKKFIKIQFASAIT